VQTLGKNPSQSAKTDLAERRERLNIRVERFMRQAAAHISLPEELDTLSLNGLESEDPDIDVVGIFEDENMSDGDNWVNKEDESLPENTILLLPSAFSRESLLELGGQEVADQERELRVGQANDALELLCDALATKSLIFGTKVRNANSQIKIMRSWGEVEKVNRKIRRYVATYRRARAALINLGLQNMELEKFQIITPNDLKMSSDMVEENRVGQRNDKIAWFWSLGKDLGNGDWMEECRF
jgi:hypothetical protein